MINFTRQATSVVRAVWRRRWLGAITAWVAAVVLGVISLAIPERHEARARIYVDTQTVLKPLMTGLAFQPDIDQQVRMLARTLISRPNVERLARDKDIGLPQGDEAQMNRLIDDLTKAIKVELSGGTNLYQISYRDVDPQRANRLVTTLVGLFMDTSADTKRRDSEEASRFLEEQIKSYEQKLTEAEGRLKDFKVRNLNVSVTTNNQDYFARMSLVTDDVNRLKVELAAAEQARDALKRELASTEPQMADAAEAAQPVVSFTPELDARLDGQRRQLDDLLRRYTEEHPDVQASRRTIRQLEEQRAREQEAARSSHTPNRVRAAAAAAAANPMFQRLRVSLAESEASVASLRAQLKSQLARLEEIKSQAGRVPQAEAEMAQLNRDYQIMQRNYEQLVTRREAASLGVKIDQQSTLADFRLVEPPRVQPKPVFPSRIQMAVVAMLLSLAIGVAAAYAASLLNPTFASEGELREFTKRPVLGVMTKVVDPRTVVLERQDRMRLASSMGLFLMIHIAWMLWIVLRTPA